MAKYQVSFIGLGAMGYPMAGHLARGGHRVCVYNRTEAKAEKWVAEYGGTRAESPAAASAEADFVFACVGNDDDLRDIALGVNGGESAGALGAMKQGALFVDHTTASAEVARELNAVARAKDCAFLDAPVSGGQAGAENGALAVMVGGDEADFARAKPLLECYAKTAELMGECGAGQLTKMVNQICIAGLVQGLSEGVAFAQNAGLDAAQVFQVISNGAAQSWQMVNRYQTMLENRFDFGFAVDWMRKDLNLCIEEAARNGSDLPVSKIVDAFYAEVQKNGGGRLDTSSLVTRLPRKTRGDA